jgi:FkbM family methyltransferase
MASWIRNLALRCLPESAQRAAKRAYYPRLLRDFPESRWPGSAVVKRLVSPGDTVVDAGANIGYVARLLAQWTGPSGRVHSIEPVPETFALLDHNMRALGLAQVTTYGMALSSREGTATMRIPEYEGGGRNYYESSVATGTSGPPAGTREVNVRMSTLDAVLREARGPVSFIKIDVEGHELDVVRGAKAILERDRPALYIEVSGDLDDASSRAGMLARELRAAGYSAYRAAGSGVEPLAPGPRETDVFFLQPAHVARLA